MAELVVLVGAQGSGKSSFYRARLAATHALVSKDLMPSARDKDARQARDIAALLAAGRDVAVDNTSPTPAVRAPLVALARAHGARVVSYFLDVPLKECLARNAARTGKARIPPVAVVATYKKLVPPTRDEGFDAVFRVVPREDGGFDVT